MTTATVFPTTANFAPATRLRLTRRGRVVLTGAVVVPLVSALIAFGLGSSPAAAGNAESAAAEVSYVTVAMGESLWSIAESVAPGHDPRDVIADIVKFNGLDSANVPAGMSIAVPSY